METATTHPTVQAEKPEGTLTATVAEVRGDTIVERDKEDDEPLTLPSDTLAHLQAFLTERREREERFQALASQAERDHEARASNTADPTTSTSGPACTTTTTTAAITTTTDISMDLFEEDWQMSQFWYDQPTQLALTKELTFADFQFRTHPPGTFTIPLTEPPQPINVAIVSGPSVFVQLLSLKRKGVIPKHIHPTLFEFDTRFSILCPPSSDPASPRFVEYDFNHPLRLPSDLQGKFDSVLVDPPFLSAECQAGAAVTVRWLLKKAPEGVGSRELEKGVGRRVVVCTGERVAGLVERYYAKEGVRETDWSVVHERGLSNPFRCLSSYEGERWRWTIVEDADQ